MKDDCQQYRASMMGTDVIPGLLESIRKATTERREYGKMAADARAMVK